VLAILVGINVYVFFFSPGSLKQVSQAAQAAATTHDAGGRDLTPPTPTVPVVAPAAKASRRDGVVREHEGLSGVLRREGLAPADADAVLRALQPVLSFKRDIRAGQKYAIRLGGDGRLEGFELRAGAGVVYTVGRLDGTGKWSGKKSGPAPSSSAQRGSASARAPSASP
jgi:hypothetical protein